MALTVGSDAYLSVAAADSYHAARGRATWAAASMADREAAIIAATQYVDARYRFVGRPAAPDQPLAWPRLDAMAADGRTLDEIPAAVVHATAELALIALDGPLVPVDETVAPWLTRSWVRFRSGSIRTRRQSDDSPLSTGCWSRFWRAVMGAGWCGHERA